MKQYLIVIAAVGIVACDRAAEPTSALPANDLILPLPATQYETIELGTLGGTWSAASGINAGGQVAGKSAGSDGLTHGFLWDAGTMQDIGSLGRTYTEPVAINDAGWIVGRSATASNDLHAFVWNAGVMTDLGTLGGASSTPTAINALGQVTGQSFTAGGVVRAFLWEGGVMQDIGTLGGSRAWANAMNDAGQITGSSETSTGAYHAFRWSQGEMLDVGAALGDLDTWGGAINRSGQMLLSTFNADNPGRGFFWDGTTVTEILVAGHLEVLVTDLNDRGQVIGVAQGTGLPSEGFIWQNGVARSLGFRVTPYVISEAGEVVGSYTGLTGSTRAFIWRDGTLQDLHPIDPAYTTSSARAITANGWILGNVWIGLSSRGFLWKPMP